MDERAKRIGLNEALFRDVNERLEGLNKTFATLSETFALVCECGNVECAEQIVIPTESYLRVREDPAQFVIIPSHVKPDTESIVAEVAGYAVVRKDPGGPEELARETAPD